MQVEDLRLRMVTSSAVGRARRRSASFGPHASAMAIIARWRMPPESLCGLIVDALLGRGNAHQLQTTSIALARASAAFRPWCRRIASMIWLPIVVGGGVERGHRLPGRSIADGARRAGRAARSWLTFKEIAALECTSPPIVEFSGGSRLSSRRATSRIFRRARSADKAERAAAPQGEVDAVERHARCCRRRSRRETV